MTDTLTDEAQEEQEEAPAFVPSSADMCFTTKKFVLLAKLEQAAGVLPSRDLMPVLKNFMVEADDRGLRIAATDLELSVIASTELCTTERPGTAVFPGKVLLAIAQECADGDVMVDVTEGTAHISAGTATWDIMLMDGSEYPAFPNPDEADLEQIDRGRFLGALQTVKYAVCKETVRPPLMQVSVLDGKMRAADGARFQQADVAFIRTPSFAIPVGAVDDLVKILRSTDQPTFEFGQTESHLIFRVGGDCFLANRFAQRFPDVEQMVLRPSIANNKKLAVDRDELLAAIRRVRITADKETSAIVLEMGQPGKLLLSSVSKVGSRGHEEVACHWTSGEHVIAAHHVHLTEMLAATDAKTATLWMGEDTATRKSPIVLRDDENPNTVGILNQLRLDYVT